MQPFPYYSDNNNYVALYSEDAVPRAIRGIRMVRETTEDARPVIVSPQRWYIDGSVKCFNGGHAPLALLAIFVLAVCVAIIPLSLGYITAKLHVGDQH